LDRHFNFNRDRDYAVCAELSVALDLVLNARGHRGGDDSRSL